MGLFNNSVFRAPDFNMGDNSQQVLGDYLTFHNHEQEKQRQFQQDLLNLQSNIRMNELSRSMAMQPPVEKPKPNVVYNPLITPYQQGMLQLGHERLGETSQNNDEKNNIAQQNANTRADAVNNPNIVQMKTAGGQTYLYDRKSGQIINTGISQGTLTDQQKADNTVGLENVREGNREKLEGVRQGNRLTNIGARGEQTIKNTQEQGKQSRLTKQTASPNSSANLPSQEVVGTKLRAQEFINKNPNLAKFVTIDPNTGLVNIAAASQAGYFSSGLSNTDRQKIMDAIYPNRQSFFDRPDQSTTQVTASDPGPVQDIIVMKDGKRFKLNNPEQLKEALSKGYTQVK